MKWLKEYIWKKIQERFIKSRKKEFEELKAETMGRFMLTQTMWRIVKDEVMFKEQDRKFDKEYYELIQERERLKEMKDALYTLLRHMKEGDVHGILSKRIRV